MIIFLNGTSSSGKTSIARELQEMLPGYFLNFSIDSILYALPPTALQNMTSGRQNPELDYDKLEEGYYQAARALAESGNSLILDNAIVSQQSAARFEAVFGDLAVVKIGVHCSLEELNRREHARGDRTIGEATRQFSKIHRRLNSRDAERTRAKNKDCASNRMRQFCDSSDPNLHPQFLDLSMQEPYLPRDLRCRLVY